MAQKVIKSVRRVFEILELFDKVRRPLAAKEISKTLGYPLVSTHELLKSMNELGYADFDQPSWTYMPSRSFISVLDWVPDILSREEKLLAFVSELNVATKETINISRPINTQIRIIHGLESKHTVGVSVSVGTMMPLAGSLTGVTALAALNDTNRKALTERIARYDPEQAKTLDIGLIETIEGQLRKTGMAFQTDLYLKGIGAICIPIKTIDEKETLVLGVVGPSERIRDNAKENGKILRTLIKDFGINTSYKIR